MEKLSGFPLKWRKKISRLFRTFQHHKHQKIRPTVLPLTTFYVILIRKHGSVNVTWNIFCWFIKIIIIITAGKLNCKNYSITYLVFRNTLAKIPDFFSTSVQFQDFSGPENLNSNFRTFQDPWEPELYMGNQMCSPLILTPMASSQSQPQVISMFVYILIQIKLDLCRM